MYIPKRMDDDMSRQAKFREGDEEDFADLDIKEAEEEGDFLKMAENLDRMEKANEKYSEKARVLTQRLMTAQNPNIIDRNALIVVAAVQRERFFGCLSLPFSFFVFLLFAMSASLHEDITNTYMIESGLRNELGGGIGDVSDAASWFEWMEGVIGSLSVQEDIFGQPITDKSHWGRVLFYNQVTGPVVLEQLRSKRELCFDGDSLFGDMMCYPMSTREKDPIQTRPGPVVDEDGGPLPKAPVDSNGDPASTYNAVDYPSYNGGEGVTLQDRRDFWDTAFFSMEDGRRRLLEKDGRQLREARSEYMGNLPGGTTADDAYNAFLYPNVPTAVTIDQIRYLKARGWLDAQTKQITVKALLLNSEVGRPRLEQVHILFRFSRGGGVFARLTMESLFLKMFAGPMNMGADFVFMIILLAITIMETNNLVQARRRGEFKQTLKKGWTILEWLIIFFGWLCMLGYAAQNTMRSAVNDAMEAVVDAQQRDLPAEINQLGTELLNKADNMVFFTSYFRILQAEYHVILMFRFFTAFRAQPRLGVITDTLEASVIDIIHFLIVLIPTFCAYAISACFIFGRRMPEYSTLNASIGMCFKMLMEGEYDWDNLAEEHWLTAALWCWTFMVLLVLIMMNMVLAIVMDIYTEMQKKAGDSEAVWTTFYNLWQRIYRARTWVSNRELLEEAEKMDRLIAREDLLKTFDRITDQQLGALIAACRYQSEQDSSHDMAIEDSMRMTMAIKLAIDKVHDDMMSLQEGTFKEISSQELFTQEGMLQDISCQMATHNHWMLSIQWQLQQLQWQWGAMEKVHGSDARLNTGAKPWLDKDSADIVL